MGGGGGGGGGSHRNFDSNGPDVKIRGTANHIFERYCQLARDANSAGDRVAAESFLQHAEHYYRIMLAQGVTPMQRASNGQAGNGQQPQAQPAQQPQQGNGNGNTASAGDNSDGDGDGEQPSLEMELEAALDPNAEPAEEAAERDEANAA